MPTSLESGADARALTALTRRWHPVAYSTEISQQPFGTTLLGEPVVVWRDETGRPHAMRDLCIRRGTASCRWDVLRAMRSSALTMAGGTPRMENVPVFLSSQIRRRSRRRPASMHTIARSATGLSGLHCYHSRSSLSGPLHRCPNWKQVSGLWSRPDHSRGKPTLPAKSKISLTSGISRGFIQASWVILSVRRFRHITSAPKAMYCTTK